MRVYIIRYAEIGLKGKNRKNFEDALKRNIERVTGMKVKNNGEGSSYRLMKVSISMTN